MKLKSALLLLFLLVSAVPGRALRLEPVRDDTAEPLPVVDIQDDDRKTVAQLFVQPGETMKLNGEIPVAGAGFYEALPGEEYYVLIPPKFSLPRLGKYPCPCALYMDKIAWSRDGKLTGVTGLLPYLQSADGSKIALTSDVKHPRIADGKLFFTLKGHGSSEYWMLIRFGQVVDVGGPLSFAQIASFLFLKVLPLALAGIFIFSVVGAVRLMRGEEHPEKSFIELMGLSFRQLIQTCMTFYRERCLPFYRRLRGEPEPEEE